MSGCQECGDTGWKVVRKEERDFAVRCECFQRTIIARLLETADIPDRYGTCSINNFEGTSAVAKEAKDLAYKFITDFPGDGRGLLLMGPCGVGKTHLAVGILKYLMDTYHTSCLFYDFRQLLQDLRATYTVKSALTESEIFERISKAKVLLLDELGAEKISGWLLDTLTYLINYRYNNKQVTLITTNYLDVAEREGDEILQERIGYRLRSRLFEMCQTLYLGGKDFRKIKSDKHSDGLRKALRGKP
jgi:DNA replication protein DnaC